MGERNTKWERGERERGGRDQKMWDEVSTTGRAIEEGQEASYKR